MAEFQTGETVAVSHGGTGLSSIGSAGQILKVNAAGNALEFSPEGDVSITNLVAPTNADLTFTTSGTGNIVLDSITVRGATLSSSDSTSININENLVVDGTASVSGALTASTSLNIAGDGATVTGIKDEDDMSSNSDTKLATQQSIKAYVDSQLTASDLDFSTDDSAALSIDLDSETLHFAGGTGITTSSSTNTVTFTIDSTVATLTDSQTLTNKILTSPTIATPTITGNAIVNEIVSNGTNADLSIEASGTGNINLTAGADVVIPVNIGLILDGTGAEKIESDGTDISISVGSGGDINIPANIGLTFGNDGEKIEGDGTDLTISGNNINLTAVADIVVPADVGITFGTGEKIEGDNTDLTITSGAKINLTATSDIHVPNNVGIVFGGDSEKIEGDGTDMTISANNLTVDAVADITLDAGDADIVLKDDGAQYAAFTNSSGNLIIKSGSTTMLTGSGANATFAGNVTVDGNLDVTGTFDLSDSNFTNAGDIQLDSITGDGDTDTSITFSGSNVITIAAGGENQVTFTDGAIVPSTDNNIDLGTSSVEFKDAFFDGTVTTDALVADTANIDGGSIDGATLGTNSAITQAVIDNVNIDGATIGHTSDTDLITLSSGVVTVAGELDATSLDISGDADIDGTLEADAITVMLLL